MANYCPNCAETLAPPGTRCAGCGWHEAQRDHEQAGYPTLDTLRADVAEHLRGWKGAAPHYLPTDPAQAAHVWLKVLEGPKDGEQPHRTAKGWRWPYADRVVYCLRRYLQLELSGQKTVIAAREDRIAWRGDDIEFFSQVIEQTFAMREVGREKYIAEARKTARAVIRGTKRGKAA